MAHEWSSTDDLVASNETDPNVVCSISSLHVSWVIKVNFGNKYTIRR